MPSQPFDRGWGFGPVLDLIDSDVHIAPSILPDDPLALVAIVQSRTLKDKTSTRSLHLGSFGKLFAELGISNDQPLSPVSPTEVESEEPSSSDDGPPSLSSGATDEVMAAKPDHVRFAPPKKKVVSQINQQVSSKDVITSRPPASPKSPSTELYSPTMPPGLTKTQRKKWRRKHNRTQVEEFEKELATQSKQVVTLMQQQEKTLNNVKVVADSAVPRTHQMQTRAQSRSNVSAKIRPVSPVKVDFIKDVPVPLAIPYAGKPAGPSQLSRAPSSKNVAAPSLPSALAAPAASGPQAIHEAGMRMGYSPAQLPLPVSSFQHNMVGTPVAVHHRNSPPPFAPPGYCTPQASSSVVHSHGLVPRTVQPVIVQRPQQSQQPFATPQNSLHPVVLPQSTRTPCSPSRLTGPITIRPKVDRNFHFFNQLLANFPEEMPWLVSPMQLCNEKTTTEGIHVFVDASNIMIGFRFALKRYPRIAPFEMSFDSLALLMERRRPVAKRVFAGSHREADPLPYVTKLQEVSKAIGYENYVQEQVFIRREETERKKFFKDVERIGFQRAVEKSQSRRAGNDSGSDSETGSAAVVTPSSPLSAPKWVEQGVDELLHLKMCQSIIDTEAPSTMVLATGDGAQAEHSDGFLAQVERALKKGWKVELISWKQQLNGGYKSPRFRKKWGERFKIIELDEYLEGLVDT